MLVSFLLIIVILVSIALFVFFMSRRTPLDVPLST
jgi:hypothetical protein